MLYATNASCRKKMNNKHCLIVEDEVGIQNILSRILLSADISSSSCTNAARMISLVEEKDTALIFLDIGLERSDALESFRKLREVNFQGAIQLISGRSPDVLEAVRQFGEQEGLRVLKPLSKPFRSAAIRQILADEHLINSKAADADTLLEKDDVEPLSEGSFWCRPWMCFQTRKLASIEVNLRIPRGDTRSRLIVKPFEPETSEQQLMGFRYCQQQIWEVEQALAYTETPFSVVLPANLWHWRSINIPSLSCEADGAARSPMITLDFTEHDVLEDVDMAQRVLLQLRIQNIRTRLSGAGGRYLQSNLDSLPFQEVALNPKLLDGSFEERTGLPIAGIVEAAKRSGAVVLAGPISTGSSASSILKRLGADLYIDGSLQRPFTPLAEFAAEWRTNKTEEGASIRRALPEDLKKGFWV